MKNSEKNLSVIENFILHVTHCSGGEDNFEEPINLTPKQLYEMARDYIKEDHVDGEGNPDDELSDVVYSQITTFKDVLDNAPQHVRDFYEALSPEDKKDFVNENSHSASKGFEFGMSDPFYDVITTVGHNLTSKKEIVLEELSEGAVGEKGRTANGNISMIMSLGGYEVSYVNEVGDCNLKEFDNREEADSFFNELKEQHPECI